MSLPVPPEELAATLDRRSNAAYLLTVGEDGRTHCVATTLDWLDDELVAPAGPTSIRNAEARGTVVLLSPPVGGLATPPPDEDGYTLIVDAEVTPSSSDTSSGSTGMRTVRMRPTHAVLHRPAVAPDHPHGDGCLHDCVHVYGEAVPG